jgi:peroxiredoxin
MDTLANVADTAQNIKPLQIGDAVPDAEILDSAGNKTSIHRIVDGKTILIFYRGGWCPYCNTQLRDLAKSAPKLVPLGYKIVGITPDRPTEVEKTSLKHTNAYTIFSDSHMHAAKAFGIAFRVDDMTIRKYALFGINLERASGEKHHLLPVPSVFITDPTLAINFAYSNPDYKVRLKGAELLAYVQDNFVQKEEGLA